MNLPTKYLATDLDGTLIPITVEEAMRPNQPAGGLSRSAAERRFAESTQALGTLHAGFASGPKRPFGLVFVTGRHFESVCEAIVEFTLPMPDWIICDVGSRCLRRRLGASFDARDQPPRLQSHHVSDQFESARGYDAELQRVSGDYDVSTLMTVLPNVTNVRPQEDFKQGRHKHSFYSQGDELERCVDAIEQHLRESSIPLGVVASIDPFTGDGLIDLMPPGVNKAFALRWWIEQHNVKQDDLVFAGDSGNDLAAMISGVRTIVVGNASRDLATKVAEHHRHNGWQDRVFLANRHNTAAVLDGCRWFGLMNDEQAIENAKAIPVGTCPSDLDVSELSRVIGATPVSVDQTRFVVYAPERPSIAIEFPDQDSRRVGLRRTDAGYHVGVASDCRVGTAYRIDLGDGRRLPDPASRFQAGGVHGPSTVVDPTFAWTDANWQGVERRDLVLYELHLGAYTEAGTYLTAIDRLDELVDLGVTGIEIMPVNECAGRWNWGYDGVNWFAPMSSHGTPDDLRGFVDAAHARGLAVYLDVVYNHFGPEGNYLHDFGSYVSPRHRTAWGDAPNTDSPPASTEIRRFIVANAIHWLSEYHFDGLRVDAIHCIADDSEKHLVRELSDGVAAWANDTGRSALLIAESNVYDGEMLTALDDETLGTRAMGFAAEWCDDFLHSVFAVVRPDEQLSNRTYKSKTDLQQVLEKGFVFEGTVRDERQRRLPKHRVDTRGLIYSIQNHDFIGNHPLAKRFHQLTSPAAQRTAATLLILSPAIPMIFMGEEFACEQPFSFFVDFNDDHLREAVVNGRKSEYPQHDWEGGMLPTDPSAFASSKIGSAEEGCAAMRAWYRNLIACRKDWIQSELLSAAQMRVVCDLDSDLYGFQYQSSSQIGTVAVRLTNSHRTPVTPVEPNALERFFRSLGFASPENDLHLNSSAARFRSPSEASDAIDACEAWIFDRSV